MNTTFYWNAEKTPAVINSALKTLSGRYPQLKGCCGDMELVFEQNSDASVCSVKKNGNQYVISSGKANMALRMVGTLMAGLLPEKEDYCPFNMFGVMIDCSRNSVMTVSYMKSYLERLAVLGYNMVMIYTEETYKIADEPFFGLMRGAYSEQEIKELDDYAASLGIELIPCIQTLAHLEQMFRWAKFNEINDCNGILLVDEPKTYELIEKMIASWQNSVRSRRIHLGMDEAHGIGSGRFKTLHGEESRFSIINRHLTKVIEICEKYGFKPMIWSDMYFRIGSKNNDYYDKETVIPEEVVKQIPQGVELVYWDYYHEEKDFYTDWIKRHRALGSEPLMGSGVWTWNKFWYDHFYTETTVVPCLEACREQKVKDVFFTMWGDDGGYCDYDTTFAGLAFAGELAFTGAADSDVINRKFAALFDGACYDDIRILADLCYTELHRLLWDDPLMLLYHGYLKEHQQCAYYTKWTFDEMRAMFAEAAEKIAKVPVKGNAGDLYMAKMLIDTVLTKINYADAMFKAYQSANRRDAVSALLPLAVSYKKSLKAFTEAHLAMWKRHNKPFGMESIQIRFAGLNARADELIERLQNFAAGQEDSIPEMEDLQKVMKDLDLQWGTWGRLSHGTTLI